MTNSQTVNGSQGSGRSKGRPRKNRVKLCLSVNADVVEAVRIRAEQNGQTLSGAIEQAIREWLKSS